MKGPVSAELKFGCESGDFFTYLHLLQFTENRGVKTVRSLCWVKNTVLEMAFQLHDNNRDDTIQ